MISNICPVAQRLCWFDGFAKARNEYLLLFNFRAETYTMDRVRLLSRLLVCTLQHDPILRCAIGFKRRREKSEVQHHHHQQLPSSNRSYNITVIHSVDQRNARYPWVVTSIRSRENNVRSLDTRRLVKSGTSCCCCCRYSFTRCQALLWLCRIESRFVFVMLVFEQQTRAV